MKPCFKGSIAPAFGDNAALNTCGCASSLSATETSSGMSWVVAALAGLALAFVMRKGN